MFKKSKKAEPKSIKSFSKKAKQLNGKELKQVVGGATPLNNRTNLTGNSTN